jgi:hypothetical protein
VDPLIRGARPARTRADSLPGGDHGPGSDRTGESPVAELRRGLWLLDESGQAGLVRRVEGLEWGVLEVVAEEGEGCLLDDPELWLLVGVGREV